MSTIFTGAFADLIVEQIKETLSVVRRDEAFYREELVRLKGEGFILVDIKSESAPYDEDENYIEKWKIVDSETGEVLASGEGYTREAIWQDKWFNRDNIEIGPMEGEHVVEGLRDHDSFAHAIIDWVLEHDAEACHFLVSVDRWEERFLPCP